MKLTRIPGTAQKPSPTPDLPQIHLVIIAVILVMVWGTAFTMVTVGVRYMSPNWLVCLRTIVASIVLFAYMIFRGNRLPSLRDTRWIWYAVLAMTGMVIPFILTATGQKTVDSGVSAIITSMMPLITIILAHYFANERLTFLKVVGFLIGFIGIVILFLPEELNLGLVADWKSQSLILCAATCYAVTTIIAKRAPETTADVGAVMMVFVAALVALILASLEGLPTEPIPLVGWLAVFGLGIGSTGIATILYLFVVAKKGPSTLAKINYFPPVAAVFAGVIFLGEPFTWRIALSFILILVGVLVARNPRPLKPPVKPPLK